MSKLSVIVITQNEEANIARCLGSVQWADEVIVVDSGSDDDTVAIAQNYGAHVYHQSWLGYGPQKNKALEKATGEWVLSLDADEYLLEEDAKQLQNLIGQDTQASAFSFLFEVYFFGQKIKYSYGKQERHVRLFKRLEAAFDSAFIHENLVVEGLIKDSSIYVQHETIKTMDQVLQKMNHYSTLGANKRYQQNKKPSLWQLPFKMLLGFVKVYLLRRGFLDGRYGFIIAVCHVHSIFYRQVKLLQMWHKI